MEIYLLKSSAILVIFWLLYVFFLEKENMHRFKRFYLVTSVLVAFIIPLLSITQYIYVESTDSFNFSNNLIPFAINEPQGVIETPFWTLESILWSVYILGVVLFSFRFIKNLFGIVKTIKTNEKQKQSSITFVLLKHLINPHTFLNFIFLNKFKFQKNEVPKEVLLHEEIHAKQRHSLDILFIELMQIVFWFQPFIWLFKCRIKLNHEFLADQAVIDAGYKPSTYQNTLLNYSSHQDYGLANAIDYSSIKKRFTVMKTQTSQQKKWTLRLLVLPLLGLLFYSFSNHEIVEVEKSANILVNGKPCDQCTLSVEAIKNLELNTSKNQEIVSFSAKISGKMTEFIKGNKLNETIKKYLSETSTPEFVQLLNIKVKGQKTPRNVLIQVKEGQQRIPSAKEIESYNTWAKNVRSKFVKYSNGAVFMPPIEEEGLVENLRIYSRMTKEQKEKAVEMPYPNLDADAIEKSINESLSQNQQKPPTAKEIAEYNAWAKKFSNKINKAKSSKYSDYPIIKQRDLVRYKSIYSRMTEKQKKDAEAFPNIPPPPPPPVMDTIYTYKRLLNRVKSNPKNREANIIYLKKIYNEMNEKQKNQVENPSGIENLPPPPPPPPPTKVPQYKNGNKKTLKQIIEETPENVESGYEVLDNGESHYFIVYKGKKTYYNKDGFVTDDKGNILPPPPPAPLAPIKANKSKGGPNSSDLKLVVLDKKPEPYIIEGSYDYKMRQLLLKTSRELTKPVVYYVNGKTADYSAVREFLNKNQDADIHFSDGEANSLTIAYKKGKMMSEDELQIVYTKLFKYYKNPHENTVYAYKTTSSEERATLPPPPPPISNKQREKEVPLPKKEEGNNIDKKIIAQYAKTHPESVSKVKINGKLLEVVEIPEDQEGFTTVFNEKFKYIIKDGITTYIDSKGVKFSEKAFKAHLIKLEKGTKQTSLNQNSKLKKDLLNSIEAINAYASTNTYEKMLSPASIDKRKLTDHIKVLENYMASNSL